MHEGALPQQALTRLMDIVFPGDTNHHGTLFAGNGLAYMNKAAFISALRHTHIDMVMSAVDDIRFKAPARLGDIIEVTGRVIRADQKSLDVKVDLIAEAPLTGKRHLCGSGTFNMVPVEEQHKQITTLSAPIVTTPADELQTSEIVFPEQSSPFGGPYGGNILAAMGKTAFVAATRYCRKTIVMASSPRVNFESKFQKGEVVELNPRIVATGRTSITIEIDLQAEDLKTGSRRQCGHGTFIMVAIDENHQPTPVQPVRK
ncbi:acyl-CoA thioesterase [Microvirga sp. W0021]|uniref:Acyl-CoA thioesterase n=1 Tax=Hohaiivirga grylli TaxID=3133970 RepID=A0ABV0BLU8_9HYPH